MEKFTSIKLFDFLSRVSFDTIVYICSRSSKKLIFDGDVKSFFDLEYINHLPKKYYYSRLVKEVRVKKGVLVVII